MYIYNLHLYINLYLNLIYILISIDFICILYPEKSFPDTNLPVRWILIRTLTGEHRVKTALEGCFM